MPSGERQGVVGVGSGGEEAVAALLEPVLPHSRRILRICQSRVSIDPLDGIFVGSEFPDKRMAAIGPRYLHAPNAALLHHWR